MFPMNTPNDLPMVASPSVTHRVCRRLRGGVLLGCLSALAGCVIGPRVSEYRPVEAGHGVTGQFIVRGRRLEGELLAVSDSALVIQSTDGLLLISKLLIDEASFGGLGVVGSKDLVGDVLEQYRLLSRYPAGIAPATLQALLAEAGQEELKVLRQ
jgi:hypothetical protein